MMSRPSLPDPDTSPNHDKDYFATQIRRNLAQVKALRHSAKSTPADAADRQRIRIWQSDRWSRTFADFLADPRYAPAGQFFFTHLYGPKDFDEHAPAVDRVMPTMIAVLPASGLETAAMAVELDMVAETLDAAMVRTLRKIGSPAAIDDAVYAEAYRRCGLRPLRRRQIELTVELGESLNTLTRKPFVATALTLMRGPARLAGLYGLHEFLESGFTSFRHANGVGHFLETFETRETRIMERLFAGKSVSFDPE